MSENKKESVIERAKDNLNRMVEKLRYAHKIGKKCMEMVAGDQWELDEIKSRSGTNRPCITVNKLANPLNISANTAAMERSRINVVPAEDTDVSKAKVINGLIRHIQYSDKSNAGEAYLNADFDLRSCGYGYWRVDTEYCNEMSFDQDIVINKIDEPNTVYLDPDGYFAIIPKFLHKDVFKKKYGEVDGADFWGDIKIEGNHDDEVMIVEYWEKEEKKQKIYKIELPEVISVEGGSVELDNTIQATMQPEVSQKPPEVIIVTEEELKGYDDYMVIDERETDIPTIKQYLFAGNKQLEEKEWPGKFIPIVGCFSREFRTQNGDTFYKPMVYDSIDPQRIYNYYRSQDAELMEKAPKAEWLGSPEQFKGHEDDYDTANQQAVSRLHYNAVTGPNGQLLPPPQKIPPPQPSQGYYANMMQASDEIKSTMGLFDPSLGAQENPQSGRAIIASRQQGDAATYHFTLEINAGLRRTGLILVDLISHIYDTSRTIRILGEDMTEEVVQINQEYVNKDGKRVLYDLTTGSYDVKIEIGPNSLTRRQEAAESTLEFARVLPAVNVVAPDLIASNMDFENAEQLALRLKAGVSPQILERVKQFEQSEQGGPTPEQIAMMQLKQQLGKAVQAVQGLSKENQALKGKITQDKILVEKIKAAAGIKEEQIKSQTDITEALIKANANKNPMSPAAIPAGSRQY